MKWFGACCAAGFVVTVLLGCGLWRQPQADPGISYLDYKESCGGCHKLPKPRTRTDEQWQTFMMEHRLISGQDEETAQLFADYLRQGN